VKSASLETVRRAIGHTSAFVVTYYNAPKTHLEPLRKQYEGLPAKLQAEGVDPRIPWLYNFQLDFEFK
jgi:hypothetical protein